MSTLVDSRRWVDAFANRCQVIVGEVHRSVPQHVATRLRHLVSDLPAHLLVSERVVTYAIVSNMLARIACVSGIAEMHDVAAAFVQWAAQGPTSPLLTEHMSRIVACCAAALEAMVASDPVSTVDPRVTCALYVIQRRFSDPTLTLTDVAGESGVSVWYAARLIKHTTGCGFSAHLHRQRVDASCRMLRETTLSIKQIAARVGYGSSSQFGRNFRRLMGTTPHHYRTPEAA